MIQQLTISDFSENRSNTGKRTIMLNRPGKWFVFFSTNVCGWCEQFSKEYPKLPLEEKKVNYGRCTVNEGGENSVAAKMKNSSTPINNVPYFLMYIDGKPKVSYKGVRKVKEIKEFINEYLEKYAVDQSRRVVVSSRTSHTSQASNSYGVHPPQVRRAPMMKYDFTVPKEYYPEGYKAGEGNPDMGAYKGNMLSLPREVRPWNEPYRYGGN